ncbi:unnamed protein product [Clonostachys rosea]|uniref:Uncharacterized protein n=1 Tax=Bionectria ochroleuca TaxID=29856 RepID=A0ABY6UAR7_BIOOC|nr:unnamed protein product [Clonostachys rosea]
MEFEGPFLKCNESLITETHPNRGTMACDYNAFTSSNMSTLPGLGSARLFLISQPFQLSVSKTISKDPDEDNSLIQEVQTLSCAPSWAHYTVNVTYLNGLHTISREQEYKGSIRGMLKLIDRYKPQNGVWSEDLVKTMAAYNHFAIIEALMDPLGGNYTMLYNGKYYAGVGSPVSCGPIAGSLVADTRFNTQRDNFTRSPADGPSFSVSEDLLNDALFNTTMNAAFQLGYWEEAVDSRTSTFRQFYSFASPKTILIPYLLCLALSLPFLYLGLRSLRSNGVSAIDGGLMQILMTSTGSRTLNEAAANGCLGGEENIPEDFKNMKIRFGELVSSASDDEQDNPRQIRRAGFGVDSEVIPLKRGVFYGA